MRIFDRIAGGESVYGQIIDHPDLPKKATLELNETNSRIRKFVNSSMRIVIDDANEYVLANRKSWDTRRDCGPLRPQHDSIWFEYKTNMDAYSPETGYTVFEDMPVAILANSIQLENGITDFVLQGLTVDRGGITLFPCAMLIKVDQHGEVLQEIRSLQIREDLQQMVEYQNISKDELVRTYDYLSVPALLAIGWMNCKNLTLEDVKIPEHTQRRRRKNRQPIGLDYRQIKVMPDKRKKSGTTSSHEDPQPQPLHMVRGHFKTFTAEKPLLGRIVGTFWWSHQLRGVEEMGRINHEYHTTAMGKQ